MGRLESGICPNRPLSGALVVIRLFLAANSASYYPVAPIRGLGIGWAVIA